MSEVSRLSGLDLVQYHHWVEEFASTLKGDEIILLSGPMGAGKTEFVKTLASFLGLPGAASPTFALHHSMQNANIHIDHFDLYRIQDLDELETTGFWEILQSPSLVLVEWPERVPSEYWPRERKIFSIQIEVGSDPQLRDLSWKKF